MTSKRYQKEIEAMRKLKNGINRGRSELRRFGPEEARIPKGLEEVVLPPKEELQCRVCRRVERDVEPRIIEGAEFARFRGLVKPQLNLCGLCADKIEKGRINLSDYVGGELVIRGKIRLRVTGREEKVGRVRRSLELAAIPVEESDPYRLLKVRLGKI